MPFEVVTPRDPFARSDGASLCETAYPLPQGAFVTMEEVRCAHELRLQLRKHFLRRPAPPARPWSVGVD